jgi:hypothetical protein
VVKDTGSRSMVVSDLSRVVGEEALLVEGAEEV